jgi:hypothetical protein
MYVYIYMHTQTHIRTHTHTHTRWRWGCASSAHIYRLHTHTHTHTKHNIHTYIIYTLRLSAWSSAAWRVKIRIFGNCLLTGTKSTCLRKISKVRTKTKLNQTKLMRCHSQNSTVTEILKSQCPRILGHWLYYYYVLPTIHQRYGPAFRKFFDFSDFLWLSEFLGFSEFLFCRARAGESEKSRLNPKP